MKLGLGVTHVKLFAFITELVLKDWQSRRRSESVVWVERDCTITPVAQRHCYLHKSWPDPSASRCSMVTPMIMSVLCSASAAACFNLLNCRVILNQSSSFNSGTKEPNQYCFFFPLSRNIVKRRSSSPSDKLVYTHPCLFNLISYIDLCDTPFSLLGVSAVDRLQAIQNTAGRLEARFNGRSHISPVLKPLRRLPVAYAGSNWKFLLLLTETFTVTLGFLYPFFKRGKVKMRNLSLYSVDDTRVLWTQRPGECQSWLLS